MARIPSLHRRLVAGMGWLRWLPPLLARLCLGWTYLISGWGHLGHIDRFIDYMRSLHLPLPALNAHAAGVNELVGGALLLLGLGTRYASLSLMVVMGVAIVTAKFAEVQSIDDLTFMPELLAVVLLSYLVIEGAGKASLDALVQARGIGATPAAAPVARPQPAAASA